MKIIAKKRLNFLNIYLKINHRFLKCLLKNKS